MSLAQSRLRLRNIVRNALVITVTVFVTFTMLLAVGWQKKSAAPKPYSNPCPSPRPEPDSVRHSCNVSNLTVLGKTVDRCATLQAMRLAEKEDIYVSIKTVSVNHVSRMLPVLLTWLQTLQPQQVILKLWAVIKLCTEILLVWHALGRARAPACVCVHIWLWYLPHPHNVEDSIMAMKESCRTLNYVTWRSPTFLSLICLCSLSLWLVFDFVFGTRH